jgi:hypothetical protein
LFILKNKRDQITNLFIFVWKFLIDLILFKNVLKKLSKASVSTTKYIEIQLNKLVNLVGLAPDRLKVTKTERSEEAVAISASLANELELCAQVLFFRRINSVFNFSF